MQLLQSDFDTPDGRRCARHCSAACQAQNRGDDTLLEMQQAFPQRTTAKAPNNCCPPLCHALEPWAAYWELKLRLGEPAGEIRAFFSATPAPSRRPPAQRLVAAAGPAPRLVAVCPKQHPSYRMGGRPRVRCYALLIDTLKAAAASLGRREVRRNWYAQRDSRRWLHHGRTAVIQAAHGHRCRQARPGGANRVRSARCCRRLA